jgi:hypothetical protein
MVNIVLFIMMLERERERYVCICACAYEGVQEKRNQNIRTCDQSWGSIPPHCAWFLHLVVGRAQKPIPIVLIQVRPFIQERELWQVLPTPASFMQRPNCILGLKV